MHQHWNISTGEFTSTCNVFFFSILFILRLFSSTHFRTFISFQTSLSNETTKIKFEKEIKERAPQCSKKRKKYMYRKNFCKEQQSGRVFVQFYSLFNFILVHWCFCFRFLFVLFFASFFFRQPPVVEHYFSSSLRLAHCLDTTSLMFFHLRVHTFVFIRSFLFLLDWFSRHNGDRIFDSYSLFEI